MALKRFIKRSRVSESDREVREPARTAAAAQSPVQAARVAAMRAAHRRARELTEKGARFAQAGEHEPAIAAYREAIEVLRTGFPDRAAADGVIATLQLRTASSLRALSQTSEALATAEEGRRLLLPRFGGFTGPYRGTDALLLLEIARCMVDLGVDAGGEEAIVEAVSAAVQASRDLGEREGAAALIINSLILAADGLNKLGRNPDALKARLEAVELLRRGIEGDPAQYAPVLARQIAAAAVQHAKLEQFGRAIAAGEQCRDMVHDPTVILDLDSLKSITNNLKWLAIRLTRAGRAQDAVVFRELRVELCRRAAAKDPEQTRELATALNAHAWHLTLVGLGGQGLAYAVESIELRRAAGPAETVKEKSGLATTLHTLATILVGRDRNEEARGAIGEALEIVRTLPPEDAEKIRSSIESYEELAARLDASEGAGSGAE
ncbi:hypothetical protein KDL01_15770 [Actinospica durhamensis]|uniref:Tetratricopeptide repeat protein n=1 Tax=Actinospica durhamensis TaxID=1508375 RepID=A0A941ISB2_9ACTN|nr:hypothetical protein [Actinospica durhamensis]MBR7834733.1 hypothetical protein [Actinospica durhamensis]